MSISPVISHQVPVNGASRASSRLPSYRSSYLGRFHPYPYSRRAEQHGRKVDLLQTIDLRYDNDGGPGGRPSVALSIVVEEDESYVNGPATVSSIEDKLTTIVGPPTPPVKLAIIGAVMEFVIAMRRRLRLDRLKVA